MSVAIPQWQGSWASQVFDIESFLLAVEGFLLAVFMVQYDWSHNLYHHTCESPIGFMGGKAEKAYRYMQMNLVAWDQ
jgi:hypothetical protein